MSTGTFTFASGTTGTVADVLFTIDPFHSQYLGDTTVSAAAAAEPNLKGYGTLSDLQVAMTLDPALIDVMNTNLPHIKELGVAGGIDNCSLLVDVPAGSKNHSYGGFCSLMQGKKKTIVYICNDDMVGHFALYHASVTTSSQGALVKFVVSNCIGG